MITEWPETGLRIWLGSLLPAEKRVEFELNNSSTERKFYDTDNLSGDEQSWLLSRTTAEGAILVVAPNPDAKGLRINRYRAPLGLQGCPVDLPRRFAIAGVGSSDLGAASLARTVANHYDEPVGAIVAGYGRIDLMAEALDGWFVYGSANRLLHLNSLFRDSFDVFSRLSGLPPHPLLTAVIDAWVPFIWTWGTETGTFYRLLCDNHCGIRSVTGHSKGSLSIAMTLALLEKFGQPDALKRAASMEITTLGAVVSLPERYENVRQYLGAEDSLGEDNSILEIDHIRVPAAGHSLSRRSEKQLDFEKILSTSIETTDGAERQNIEKGCISKDV